MIKKASWSEELGEWMSESLQGKKQQMKQQQHTQTATLRENEHKIDENKTNDRKRSSEKQPSWTKDKNSVNARVCVRCVCAVYVHITYF